jgi:hypothetical protein
MATSGSYDWQLNRNQVITGALRKLAVLPSGGTPSTAQISDANDALNSLVKAYQADGMPLWAIVNTSFTTVADTSQYAIGISQTVNAIPPLRVIQAFVTPSATGEKIPMNIYNRYDFNVLPTENATGTPINLYYQPLRQTGTINLWPTPPDDTYTITIHYQRPFQDMDASTDDFDFPPYWTQALIYGLAWALAPEYGIPPTDRGILAKEAEYWHGYALSAGSEEGSLFLQPDTTWRK